MIRAAEMMESRPRSQRNPSEMRFAAALALLVGAQADYFTQTFHNGAGCTGSVFQRSASFIGGCTPSGTFSTAFTCVNSSFGVLNIYPSATCSGTPTPSMVNGINWGCSDIGSSTTSNVVCVTGAYSPPINNSRLSTFYQGATCASSAAVTAGAVAQSASSGATGVCVQSFTQSSITTCNATASTASLYTSADCSGAIAFNFTLPLGCTADANGATVVSCTGSGASSGAAATTLTAAAAVLLAAASAASAWM